MPSRFRSRDYEFQQYRVTAGLRNDESSPVSAVEAVATLYDLVGTAVDCKSVSGSPPELEPGEVGSVDLYFRANKGAYSADSVHRLQASAR